MTVARRDPDAAGDWSVDRLRQFYLQSHDTVAASGRWRPAHEALLSALERGAVRSAERDDEGSWRAVSWVKQAILSGFTLADTVPFDNGVGSAFDRETFPVRTFEADDGVRLVPGGSAVRRGAYVCSGTVVMPPSYVNVGAWVDRGTMVDSHVLVGSCAQIGRDVHLSTGVKIGGVLEPAGAVPVVIEDGCFLGAQSGVFEGVVVRRGAVLAPGVILTASTKVYDMVTETVRVGEIPSGAVVVPGSRRVDDAFGDRHGLSLYAPVIVKLRDRDTGAATALEEALR